MLLETKNIQKIDINGLYKHFSDCYIWRERYDYIVEKQNEILPFLKDSSYNILEHLDEIQKMLNYIIVENSWTVYKESDFISQSSYRESLLNIMEDYYYIVNNKIWEKRRKWNNKTLHIKDFFLNGGAFWFVWFYEDFEKSKKICESLLSALWISYEKDFLTLQNLELIKKYFHSTPQWIWKINTIDEKVHYLLYQFILSNIILNNIVDSSNTEAISLPQNIFIYLFTFFNHSLLCTKTFLLHTEDFEDFIEIKKIEKILPENIHRMTLWIFIKSFLYKNYYKNNLLSWKKIFLYLQHNDLFLANKNIPYPQTFELIQSVQDEETLSKIWFFLQERKWMKIRDGVLKTLIENIIKTNHIISYNVLNLSIRYIENWFPINDIVSLWEESLKKVQNFVWNKMVLLQELIKNPWYLEEKEKKDYIDTLRKDLIYLSDDDEWKNIIFDILDTSFEKLLDDLKIEILSIKIKYNIDEKISFAKKIFKNNLENLTFKWDILSQLELTFAKDLLYKIDIYEYIFSLQENDISYMLIIFQHLQLPKNISYKAFLELSDILFKKRKFIAQIIYGKNRITLDDLHQELESKKIFQKINTGFQSILSPELYDILKTTLKLNKKEYIDEKTVLVLDILKILDQKFYEDFVLYLDYLSYEACKNMYDILLLFKYYNFSIHSFSDYLLWQKSTSQIETCKKMIHNSLLEKISHKQEFQTEVLNFIKIADFKRFQEYILSIENQKQENNLPITTNEIDNYIFTIYNNGTTEQKEFLVRKLQIFLKNIINIMHPSQTTSTCNSGFWKWSGSYSEVIWNKVFKKLQKLSEENNNEYLKRILSLNLHTLLEVENISDINNGYHELKCLYIISLKKTDFQSLILFLYTVWEIMDEIVGESYADLTELKKYYQVYLEKEFKKLKRSLVI